MSTTPNDPNQPDPEQGDGHNAWNAGSRENPQFGVRLPQDEQGQYQYPEPHETYTPGQARPQETRGGDLPAWNPGGGDQRGAGAPGQQQNPWGSQAGQGASAGQGDPSWQGNQAPSGKNDRPGWDAPTPGQQRREGQHSPNAGAQPGPYAGGPQGQYSGAPSANGPYAGAPNAGGPYAGAPGGAPYASGPYSNSPYAPQQFAAPGYPGAPMAPVRRPGTVLTAAILLWVGAGLSVLGMLMFTLILGTVSPSEFTSSMQEGYPEGAERVQEMLDQVGGLPGLVSIMWILTVLTLVAAAVAVAAGIFTLRGSQGWRIAGTVCGGLVVLSLLFSLGTPFGVLWLALAVAIIVLWWVPATNQWFKAVRGRR